MVHVRGMKILWRDNNFTTILQFAGKLWTESMKRFNKQGNVLAVVFMALTITAAGCSSTGMTRSEDVQSSLETVDNDIELIVEQLDAIGTSLDELTMPGQENVKSAFDVYSSNVSEIKKMEKDFEDHADEMTSNGKTYFEEWDNKGNQYDNPEIQRSSDERRAALGEIYDKIAENNIGVKEAFRTYVSDVNQIQAYMSNDLTTKGITSISSLADKTVRNGTHMKIELEKLQSAIEDARAEMRQTGISMN